MAWQGGGCVRAEDVLIMLPCTKRAFSYRQHDVFPCSTRFQHGFCFKYESEYYRRQRVGHRDVSSIWKWFWKYATAKKSVCLNPLLPDGTTGLQPYRATAAPSAFYWRIGGLCSIRLSSPLSAYLYLEVPEQSLLAQFFFHFHVFFFIKEKLRRFLSPIFFDLSSSNFFLQFSLNFS